MPSSRAIVLASLATAVSAGSLTDIKHVVLFMQENRAFDHYFGTMAGVRGFADPNVKINPDGRSTFEQPVTAAQSTAASYLTPYYLNYLGGNWSEATQCTNGGGYSWQAMHASLNGGLSNQWVAGNSPYSMGYFRKEDVPTQWDVANGWTIADMYTESILAATDPNRISWMSGTVNNPGTPSNPNGQGGMMLDNSATPGCEAPHLNCYPMQWKTVAEYYQAAGVSWQVYQDPDNFEDNMLAYFQQYQDVSNDTNNPLTKYGNSYIGLDKFYEDARNGNLPLVSYIIGPAELSEHQPYLPSDGAWLYNQIIDAITQGKSAKDTALFISYDEVGGYFDHVVPYTAPSGTEGEWFPDPYKTDGELVPVGPGYRVPMMIVSPWTRGGKVFTEHADHTSQIMFVEKWLEALGYKNVTSQEIPTWRREHMSDLVNAFDFDHPDFSIPTVAHAPAPLTTPGPQPVDGIIGALSANYVGAAKCLADYPSPHPPVPYGAANENQQLNLKTEQGYKQVRGALTEGRFLTFEIFDFALTNFFDFVVFLPASGDHRDPMQRWVIHQQGEGDSKQFKISSSHDGRYISTNAFTLTADSAQAEVFTITDIGNARGYTIAMSSGQDLLDVLKNELAGHRQKQPEVGLSIFSVNYHK